MNLSPQKLMAMKQEELKEIMAQIQPIPCIEYDGIKWPTFIPFRVKGAEQAIKDIMEYPSRESDILICTHAKSGEI